MYFHQFASYDFVKKYTRPRETEHRIGRVLLCEPILRNTSGTLSKGKKRKKNGGKRKTASVQRIADMEVGAESHLGSITNFVREEDIERQRHQLGMERDKTEGHCGEYRTLVVYTVPTEPSTHWLCCHPIENDLVISCTNSFSVTGDFLGSERIDVRRSRSLPPETSQHEDYSHFIGKNVSNSGYVLRNDGTEYFQWFETSSPKAIDSDIDLILLQGHPRSACIPELIESHLEQVGIRRGEESDKRKYYQSLSMLGLFLVTAIVVLTSVCVAEILSLPNAETQRPIGFTVLGIHFVLSIVGAYLFAKLRFEQYKNEVFLSAFPVPSNIASGDAQQEVGTKDASAKDGSNTDRDNSIGRQVPTKIQERILS
eukprot:jgi/Psemu1/310819/fgenesh1_kg.684_\